MKIELIDKRMPVIILIVSVIIITFSVIFILLFGVGLIWGIITREADVVFLVPWFLIAVIFLVMGMLLRRIRKK